MNRTKKPEWIKNARRIDRPRMDRWYKPNDGALDGVLIWKGRQLNHQTGDLYNVYAIREEDTGKIVGLSERIALRDLRAARIGGRVYIEYAGLKRGSSGYDMQLFNLYIGEPHAEPTSSPNEHGSAESVEPRRTAAANGSVDEGEREHALAS
jgi:hypothetical protein